MPIAKTIKTIDFGSKDKKLILCIRGIPWMKFVKKSEKNSKKTNDDVGFFVCFLSIAGNYLQKQEKKLLLTSQRLMTRKIFGY